MSKFQNIKDFLEVTKVVFRIEPYVKIEHDLGNGHKEGILAYWDENGEYVCKRFED